MSFQEVEDQLRSLLYIKGEIVVTALKKTTVELIMKRTIVMKAYLRMRLIDRGAEANEFEIITNNKYGTTKTNFNLDDLNDQMVLYA